MIAMKGVILAAGEGKRLRPLTDQMPKALLPICNTPLLKYQIDFLRKHGVEEIAVVVGYLKEKFDLRDVKIYVDRMVSGTATALAAAREFIDDDFILVYGDVFFDIRNFSDIIRRKNSIGVVRVEDTSRYGKVVFKDGILYDIIEKSESGPGFVNAGLYHFNPEIVDFVDETKKGGRGEYELTESILMFNRSREFRVVPLDGYWNDIGYPWDYLDVNMYMLEKIGFKVGENTEVWGSAVVRKPVVIGDNCTVKNCVVEKSVVGNGCVVGEFSVLKRSVLMSNSNTPHLNYVADSVIAEGCNLGAGTKIANLRFDEKNVRMNVLGERVDSGRRKFGAVIGYKVKTGINVSIYPGVKISSGRWVGAGELVNKDI